MPHGHARRPVRRALISVSDKSGAERLARALAGLGCEILSTGGTARVLREAGIEVTEVADFTGFPEIMEGRVKTLHPRIHGGLLGRRGIDDSEMADHAIAAIDLLAVNLYPFERTVADRDCSVAQAVENIDIGGPAMLRAAAKNHDGVAVLTDPAQYDGVLEELAGHEGTLGADTRFRLAVAAFNHVARYDAAIGNYLSALAEDGSSMAFPGQANHCYVKIAELRYGENPHQQAAFYRDTEPAPGTLATFRQLQGKPLSYNNIADADAAWECVRQFGQPACVIVKHANPCGVAVSRDSAGAYRAAFACDPSSAFGGIIAFNRPLDEKTAGAVLDNQFVEVILAPGVDAAASQACAGKKNVRLLDIPAGDGHNRHDLRRVGGGLLVQTPDTALDKPEDLNVVSSRRPEGDELEDLSFAWRCVKYVKSNAVVCARGNATVGIGAGQTSRVMSVRLAVQKAEDADLSLDGAVLASDAFFPFRDGLDAAAEAGVRAVIQPGGSIRDDEIITAANEHDMALVFTNHRHFRH